MNSPTDVLEVEHRAIAKIVLVASILADRLDAGQSVEVETLQRVVEFLSIYTDKYHHRKEELLLFPLLVRRGVSMPGCPIVALTREHVMGWDLIAGLSEASLAYQKHGSIAGCTLKKDLRGIADLYTNHIWKENHLLFPIIEKVLVIEDLNALSRDFGILEQEIGQRVHESLERFADGLYASLEQTEHQLAFS
jgi:hemerythrin-like domain-containing protein